MKEKGLSNHVEDVSQPKATCIVSMLQIWQVNVVLSFLQASR